MPEIRSLLLVNGTMKVEKALFVLKDCSGREVCVTSEFRAVYHCVLPSLWAEKSLLSGKRDFTQSQLILESGVSEIAKTHLKMLAVSHVHAVSKWSSSQGQPSSSTSKITGYGHLDSDLGFKERTPSKQLNSSIFLP